jgi:hypothetical protein
MRQVLITTRPRAALEAALESNTHCDTSRFEIIEADPQVLSAWLEFDVSEGPR